LLQGGDSTGGGGRTPSSRSRTSDEPHIGKYRLLKTIGKGNFAKVKLAKHIPTGKEVSFLLFFCSYISLKNKFSNTFYFPIAGSNKNNRQDTTKSWQFTKGNFPYDCYSFIRFH
jgi:serine/threonine protein kinase